MKGSTIAGVLVVAGLIGGAALLKDGELQEVVTRPVSIPCEKATKEICPGGVNDLGGKCLCFTEKEAGEVADEITADKIPANERVRVVICCDQVDPETKHKAHVVKRVKGLTPPGCQSLTDNIVLDASSNHVWMEIDDIMSAACCVDCPEDCFIKPGHHGACPRCLCGGTCKNYCPKEEK